MKKAIINFAKGAWYPRGQERLLRSLIDVGWDGDVHYFTDENQIGCPTHQERPYAFKPHALKYAVQHESDIVLWADAACWAVKSLDPLFDHIAREGHAFFHSGWNCGQWSSDSALAHFGLTRDQAWEMPMLMACCFGLDLRTPKAKEFLRRWEESIPSFPGPWTNNMQEASADTRCLGHRHDQTAASIIAAQLEMPLIIGHQTFFQYYENEVHTAFVYGQTNDLTKMNPSVCIYTQGM
jgi:hypothetical protein